MKTEFGKYLKNKRVKKNISRTIFADKIGISPSYLSSIESGFRPAPDYTTLKRAAAVLDLSREDRALFFDLAAKSGNRKTVPADLIDYINENKEIREFIRASRDGEIPRETVEAVLEQYFRYN